ncbi:MAG: NAD(P)/FAD-dependent oxidoreductase [Angelakisella sp.]
MSDVIIIGGGAAGLCCAGFAARQGLSVTVVEGRERPARKLLVTGKGRCNLTNNCSPEEFMKNVPKNPKFLYSAAYSFTAADTMELFESLGVPLKTERGNRVFPQSDSARDIVDALLRFCEEGNVRIITGRAAAILHNESGVTGVLLEGGESLSAAAVVLATGGMSYSATGSDGKGYALAKGVGHTITPLRASLIPILCRERCCADMMGLSLKNVTLSLWQKGKKKPVFTDLGELLFTHFGVSGPLVLSASAYMKGDINSYSLTIDLKPGLTAEQLDARILRDFEGNLNKNLINILGLLLPRAMVPVAIDRAGIPMECKVNQITKEQRRSLVDTIKSFALTPTGLRPIEEAVITSGGVDVREINPATMQSKLCRGLYFAGEVIDVDAYTGGFNLQIAFSTAYLAAQELAKPTEDK